MVKELVWTCWRCKKGSRALGEDEEWFAEDGSFHPDVLYRVYAPGCYFECGGHLNAEMKQTGQVAMFSFMGFRLVTPEEAERLEGTRVGGYL